MTLRSIPMAAYTATDRWPPAGGTAWERVTLAGVSPAAACASAPNPTVTARSHNLSRVTAGGGEFRSNNPRSDTDAHPDSNR